MSTRKRFDVPVPPAMQHLALTPNGYHKPWFVLANDLRVPNRKKYLESMTTGRCWICGGANRKERVFVTDPKSAYYSVSLEPPSHAACATYSAQVCPFLILPKSKRRSAGLPDELSPEHHVPEQALENPGACVLTYVKKFRFTPVNQSRMANWDDHEVVRQQLWTEGKLVTENEKGSLPRNILAELIPS